MGKNAPKYSELTVSMNDLKDIYQLLTGQRPVQKDFLDWLLPSALLAFFNGKSKTGAASARSRVFSPDPVSSPAVHRAVRDLLLEDGGGKKPYTYQNHPARLAIEDAWRAALTAGEADLSALDERLERLLRGSRVEGRLTPLLKGQCCPELLASLTLIALTLSCWNTDSAEAADLRLRELALPPARDDLRRRQLSEGVAAAAAGRTGYAVPVLRQALASTDPALRGEACWQLYLLGEKPGNKEGVDSYLLEAARLGHSEAKAAVDTERTQGLMGRADAAFDAGELKKAFGLYRELLTSPAAPVRGKAALGMYLCAVRGEPDLPRKEALQYLGISYSECGYQPARAYWLEAGQSGRLLPKKEKWTSQEKAVCVFNAENAASRTLIAALPENWTHEMWPEGESADPYLHPGETVRYLFLSECEEENLRCLLELFQAILDRSLPPKVWDAQVFLRGSSDRLRTLVDTALAHMGELLLPVTILDEEKWAAQSLLSRHPVFYPLRHLLPHSTAVLHFVVVGDTPVAEWLVREGFSLLGFRAPELSCRITVLVPQGSSFAPSLAARFPDLLSPENRPGGIPYPTVEVEELDLRSPQLMERLVQLYQEPNTYCYYAVAAEDSRQNLLRATALREALIRACAAHTRRLRDRLNDLPPIAFYCPDDAVAALSRRLVNDMEDHGDRWYNSQRLIPFGCKGQLFSWAHLIESPAEKLAREVHIQYSAIAGAGREDALRDYWRRYYHRDSSASVAASIPYRLFQFTQMGGRPLFPPQWNILDEGVFFDPEVLTALARTLERIPGVEEQVPAVAEWEHARWVRWCISRGWRAASADQSAAFLNCGSGRHQLYIARLHPCMCSFPQLEDLGERIESKLKGAAWTTRDFQHIDLEGTRRTAQLLQRLAQEQEKEPAERGDLCSFL